MAEQLSTTTKLSVCIPAYNGSQYIEKAIMSILNQTFTDFELIIVDDYSTDDTEAIVTSFQDQRLSFFKNQKRLGLVGNWNRCLELAQGQYICLFHQDDVMLPENLSRKVTILDQRLEVGLVYSNVLVIDDRGNVTGQHWFFETEADSDTIYRGLDFFNILISGPNIVSCPSVVVRRACYERLSGFDSNLPFTADWEMWLRIALFFDVAYLAQPLIQYRWHGKNESINFKGAQELAQWYQAKLIALQKYPDRVPNYQKLRLQIAKAFETQALEQAVVHYQHKQFNMARQYLHLAVKLQTITAIEKFSDEPFVTWYLKEIDRLEHESQERSKCTLVAEVDSAQRLSSQQMAERVPVRKIMGAVALKIITKPGFRWLGRLATVRRKLLEIS